MCKEERILVLVFSITYAIILLVFVITVRYIGEGVHNMKKRFEAFLIVCLSISTLIFALLWQSQRNNKDDIRALAQASAADACIQFTEYQTDGCESSYWYGVAAFRSFQQAYHSLTEGTNKAANYTFCNEVYGYLVLSPEISQSYISEIIETMSILSLDVEDENGHIKMSELRNSLKR